MQLQALLQRISMLYGIRNRLFLPTLMDRLAYLALAVNDLQTVIRKHESNPHFIRIATARCFSRIVSIYQYFEGALPFVEILCRKYPAACAYCSHLPCQCLSADRPPYSLADDVDEAMAEWTLQQWCQHFQELYGDSNRTIGIHAIIDRLNAEISEFLQLALQLPHEQQRSIERIHEEFALELADIFAWLCAVANYYGIEFEARVLVRYGGSCTRCGKFPCECRHFDYYPKNWGAETT